MIGKRNNRNDLHSSLQKRKFNRREFLIKGTQAGIAASLLGSGPLFTVPPARAAKSLKGTGEVIVCAFGGSFQEAQRKTIFEPFTKETGIKVIDTSTPSAGKVKAQVDSGNIEWDVTTMSYVGGKIQLGEKYLEKIDYSYFNEEDLTGIPEIYRAPLTCASYFYSYVLAYRTDKFPQGLPNNWADFSDFSRYPGKRTFARGHGAGYMHLPIALIGMGVPLERVKKDPPDMNKVWEFYNKIKPHLILWWDQGTQAPQLLLNAEVHIACAYSAQMQTLIDGREPVGFTYDGGEIAENGWAVMKGAKNTENAMKFIAFASRPEVQAALAERFPYGPANLKAIDNVKPEIRAKLNSAPENFAKQVFVPWDFLYSKTLDPKREQFNRDYLADQWQAWSMK